MSNEHDDERNRRGEWFERRMRDSAEAEVLRLTTENAKLRAEISESHTHGEPCESVYFVLRCDDGIEYPATACSQCHRWEQCGHPGEPCLDTDCAGLLELDE